MNLVTKFFIKTYIFLAYEPKNTNLSITIGYPDTDMYLNQICFVIRYTSGEPAKVEVLPISDITDIVDILKQVRDKYDN